MAHRILIVDDDPSMRALVALHLRAADYRVEEAEDAIAAGYQVLQAPPDLIVCDVELPHMNGLDFVAALRADRLTDSIPVIFMTATEEHYQRAKQLGRTEYLMKPTRGDVLLGAVRKYLPSPASSYSSSRIFRSVMMTTA
jgi:chemosensory pili system protein ChpA (sensor histidine kinase/response regulator)